MNSERCERCSVRSTSNSGFRSAPCRIARMNLHTIRSIPRIGLTMEGRMTPSVRPKIRIVEWGKRTQRMCLRPGRTAPEDGESNNGWEGKLWLLTHPFVFQQGSNSRIRPTRPVQSTPAAAGRRRVAGQVNPQVGSLIPGLSPTAATSPDARATGAYDHPERGLRRSLRA